MHKKKLFHTHTQPLQKPTNRSIASPKSANAISVAGISFERTRRRRTPSRAGATKQKKKRQAHSIVNVGGGEKSSSRQRTETVARFLPDIYYTERKISRSRVRFERLSARLPARMCGAVLGVYSIDRAASGFICWFGDVSKFL